MLQTNGLGARLKTWNQLYTQDTEGECHIPNLRR